MQPPTPEDVRRALAPLDVRRQKIVAGLLAMMMREPGRVREREWMAERLTQVTLLAGEFEADTPQAGVLAVQGYLKEHAATLLEAALLLFQRVGLDLEPRAAEGFTLEEALARGLAYLPAPPGSADSARAPLARDLGPQPLARLMAERGLKPGDLVAASDEQLTHKMVQRAMKGRRLTARTMGKVQRAWNKATSGEQGCEDLFDYEP